MLRQVKPRAFKYYDEKFHKSKYNSMSLVLIQSNIYFEINKQKGFKDLFA